MENKLMLSTFYIASVTLANLIVHTFGPWTIPINAFFLIGLDLTLRNVLSFRTSKLQMMVLIIAAGIVTYVANPSAERIAIASSVSFVCAAIVDWTVFSMVRAGWIRKNATGSMAGAVIDSMLFPTLAFGSFLPMIVVTQVIAKTSGAVIWSLIFNRGVVRTQEGK